MTRNLTIRPAGPGSQWDGEGAAHSHGVTAPALPARQVACEVRDLKDQRLGVTKWVELARFYELANESASLGVPMVAQGS